MRALLGGGVDQDGHHGHEGKQLEHWISAAAR